MTGDPSDDVLARVRRALGRTAPLSEPPLPPSIDEPIARLVFSDIGLPELFHQRATEMKMLVEPVRVDELPEKIAAFLHDNQCNRIMLSATPLLEQLNLVAELNSRGFHATSWRDMTADAAYDFDAGVTEVDYAVAETGTLVIRHRPEHGRLLSLVAVAHVTIVQPRDFLPDLIDLFDRLHRDGTGSGVTLISGPSKTADIEMQTVTGVHGPNVVKAFVLA